MKTTGISTGGPDRAATPARGPEHSAVGFEETLESARFTLSRHAVERLSRRGLGLDAVQASRLSSGIDKAAARGSRTSLVLMDELALLVKVPQRLVVTALAQSAMRDGVVTRIDSAVVV